MTRSVKRGVDLLMSTVLILLTLPVILVTSVGALVALRAWPIFTQHRVGRGGRSFVMVKVRTLPVSTPRYCDKYGLDRQQVPPFTRLLRAMHLDELPQLFLVPLGRMSLVGPRPEMGMLHEAMDPHHAELRTSVRPGCTGLWQISTAADGLIHEAPQYDQFYVEHHTVRLDAWILYQTVRVTILGRERIDLRSVPSWTTVPLRWSAASRSALGVEPGAYSLAD